MIKTGKATVKYSHNNGHKKQEQVRYLTIFHLLYVVIVVIAFEQGLKAGIFGILIGLVIGLAAAWAAHWGGFILNVWLPERLGIYDLTWYREETEEALSARDKVRSTIYGCIIIFVSLLWFVLCAFCSFYFTKLLLKPGAGTY